MQRVILITRYTYHFHHCCGNWRISGFNSNNSPVNKACTRIPGRSHRCAHRMRSVATRVSTAWWGRLPGLRTFPRSVARAKSIQPEEFRRRGYTFCAEGGTRRTESREQGDGKKRWMTVVKSEVEDRGNAERGEKWPPSLRAGDEIGEALFRGSVSTRQRISIRRSSYHSSRRRGR